MKKVYCLVLTLAIMLSLCTFVSAEDDGAITPNGALTGEVGAEYTAGTDSVNAGTVYSVQIAWTEIGTLHYQGATGGIYTWNPEKLQYEVSGNANAAWTDASVSIEITNKSNTTITVQAKYEDAGTGAQTNMKDWDNNTTEVSVNSAAVGIEYNNTEATGTAQTKTITGIVTASGTIQENIDKVGTISLTLKEFKENEVIETVWSFSGNTVTGMQLGTITDIELPSTTNTGNPVTAIANNAFSFSKMTSIVIPDSVKNIGENAFANCDDLKSVTIGNGVTSIGASAFQDCNDLESVIGGSSIATIGDKAFNYCSNLISFTFGNNVKSIGAQAFSGCSKLDNVELPQGLIKVGAPTFIGFKAFSEMEIPDSVTALGATAFSSCTNLKTASIGNGVTVINKNTFGSCQNLTSISFGTNILTIVEKAFYLSSNLTDVYYAGTANDWNNIDIESDNECLENATKHYNSN